ncbi:hypothetical protein [Nannocystis exedens]|nr:hypothetical protein [Nannocystis exedens]
MSCRFRLGAHVAFLAVCLAACGDDRSNGNSAGSTGDDTNGTSGGGGGQCSGPFAYEMQDIYACRGLERAGGNDVIVLNSRGLLRVDGGGAEVWQRELPPVGAMALGVNVDAGLAAVVWETTMGLELPEGPSFAGAAGGSAIVTTFSLASGELVNAVELLRSEDAGASLVDPGIAAVGDGFALAVGIGHAFVFAPGTPDEALIDMPGLTHVLARLDETGAVTWSQLDSGQGQLHVAGAADGTIVTAGPTSSRAVALRQYAPDGVLTWEREFAAPPESSAQPRSLALAPDGTIGLALSFEEALTVYVGDASELTLTEAAGSAAYLRIAGDGARKWVVQGSAAPSDLAFADDGRLWLAMRSSADVTLGELSAEREHSSSSCDDGLYNCSGTFLAALDAEGVPTTMRQVGDRNGAAVLVAAPCAETVELCMATGSVVLEPGDSDDYLGEVLANVRP